MKIATLLLFLFLFALACSSGRGDPLGPGGSSSSPAAGRANLAVTTSNQYEACQLFFELIFNSYGQAIDAIANGPEKQARSIGAFSGVATASIIEPDTSGTDLAFVSDLEVRYTGYYSDTGTLFANGKLKLFGQWSTIGGNFRLSKFDLDGTVEFSGDYAATVEFKGFRMALDGNGQVLDLPAAVRKGPAYSLPRLGTVTIMSEGVNPIWFNPYEYDWASPDDEYSTVAIGAR